MKNINLESIIREKGEIPGTIVEIDTFYLDYGHYGKLNCALVINKVFWYALRFISYDIGHNKLDGNLLIRKNCQNWTLGGAKNNLKKLKDLLISKQVIEDFYSYNMTEVMGYFLREFKILKSDNPDDYLRPLDIVKRKTSFLNHYHFAIYLGHGMVCHISDKEGNICGDNPKNENNFLPKSFPLSSEMWVRMNDWKKFLSNRSEVVCYHSLIVIKKPSTIIDNLKKALEGEYVRGEYELIWNNCEHFVNLIYYDINYSKQSSDHLSYSPFLGMTLVPPPEGITYCEERMIDQFKGKINHHVFEGLEKKRDLSEKEIEALNYLESYIESIN